MAEMRVGSALEIISSSFQTLSAKRITQRQHNGKLQPGHCCCFHPVKLQAVLGLGLMRLTLEYRKTPARATPVPAEMMKLWSGQLTLKDQEWRAVGGRGGFNYL